MELKHLNVEAAKILLTQLEFLFTTDILQVEIPMLRITDIIHALKTYDYGYYEDDRNGDDFWVYLGKVEMKNHL